MTSDRKVVLNVKDLRLDASIGPLVEDVSFTVGRGEMVGLVGESGCGKTVTALSIMGLLPGHAVRATRGSIVFEGSDLLGLNEAQMNALRGERIAMIFQEPMTSLNPVMRIGDQIAEVLALHRDLGARARETEVARLLDLVRMPSAPAFLAKYPHQLSGGQRQRVMIAMALACEPTLLIADEPTTALDVTVQAQILDLIREMQDRFGMACILVTHDLGVVAETCARAVVMYAGRVIETATTTELFSRPRHRYTEALLRTVPAANEPGAPLPAIRGFVPPPDRRPTGCRFRDRCHAAEARCAEAPPMSGDGTHRYACWNPAP